MSKINTRKKSLKDFIFRILTILGLIIAPCTITWMIAQAIYQKHIDFLETQNDFFKSRNDSLNSRINILEDKIEKYQRQYILKKSNKDKDVFEYIPRQAEYEGQVAGQVIDRRGMPISSVIIIRSSDNAQTYSDQNGYFVFPARKGEMWQFTRNGYIDSLYQITSTDFEKILKIKMRRRNYE